MSRIDPLYGWLPGKEGEQPLWTLFDCARHQINLKVTCELCARSAIIDTAGHYWQCEQRGLSDHLSDLQTRLRCRRCSPTSGQRHPQISIRQTKETADSPLLPGPDEAGWKRILNGQRG